MSTAPAIHPNPNIKKVLVVGPNGNIGRHLIPALLAQGYNVRALQYRSEVEARPGLEIVHGNTLDVESVDRAVEGVDAVCHMVRATGPGSNPFEKWFNCAVAGTANLLEAAKKFPLRRFIAGGADNVFGHVTIPHYDSINENSPKRFADGYYGLFKIVEEEMCRQYYLGFQIPTVIARFGLIWDEAVLAGAAGSLDKANKQILKKIDRDGNPLLRHDVHMDDVIQGILLCLAKDEAVGENFNFLAAAPYSASALCDILSAKYDWPVVEQHMDWYSWTAGCEKARSVLGYKPQIDVLENLRAHLAAE